MNCHVPKQWPDIFSRFVSSVFAANECWIIWITLFSLSLHFCCWRSPGDSRLNMNLLKYLLRWKGMCRRCHIATVSSRSSTYFTTHELRSLCNGNTIVYCVELNAIKFLHLQFRILLLLVDGGQMAGHGPEYSIIFFIFVRVFDVSILTNNQWTVCEIVLSE